MKKTFLHGIVAGLLAGFGSIYYSKMYFQFFEVDFSVLVNPRTIMLGSTYGTLLASLGYYLMCCFVKVHADFLFNMTLLVMTFAAFISGFFIRLPLDMLSPELFPWLIAPMHVLPPLFWLVMKPLFFGKNGN